METLIYMARVGGGWTHAEPIDAVVTIVEARHYINKHSTLGRPFVRLITAANTIRVNHNVGKT